MSPRPFDDDPVQRVLDRLSEMGKTTRWVGNQHLAQCPGHDDPGASLAVREGEDSAAMLYCHAGCATDDVVAAMGWRMADLFAKKDGPSAGPLRRDHLSSHRHVDADVGIIASGPPDAPGGPHSRSSSTSPDNQSEGNGSVALHPAPVASLSWVADYVYRLAGGTPAFKVTRYAKLSEAGVPVGKSFHQFRRDVGGAGWTAGLNGAKPPLYRLPEVLAAVAAGQPVLVVEGEKDADAAAARGICATTSSGGAGKWQPEHTETLRGAAVVVVADDDPPAKRYAGQRHAVAVYRALEPVAASVVVALPAQGCKDLSEQLEAGYEAWAVRPTTVAALEGLWAVSTPQQEGRLDLMAASQVTIRRVRWGWQDRMPIGELTLIPGREGVGKSLLLAWLAAELTKGTLPGEFVGSPRGVLYVASEDSWAYTVAPRLKAAGADLARVFRVDALDGGRVVLPADCAEIPRLVKLGEAAALMLDPVLSLIKDNLSVNQAGELRQALEPLRRAAEVAEIMVLGLAHFNKTTDVDVLSKIPGSRAWAEVARAAFGVAEDRDAGCYVGSQIKNNLGRVNLPNLSYRIESVLLDASDGQTDVGRLVWTGESDVGIEEVLGRKPEKRARETSDTTAALITYIEECGYPVALQQVYGQFPEIQQETVRQTLRRAAERGKLSNPLRGHYGPGHGVSDT